MSSTSVASPSREPTAIEKWLWFLDNHPEYAFVKGYSVGFGSTGPKASRRAGSFPSPSAARSNPPLNTDARAHASSDPVPNGSADASAHAVPDSCADARADPGSDGRTDASAHAAP